MSLTLLLLNRMIMFVCFGFPFLSVFWSKSVTSFYLSSGRWHFHVIVNDFHNSINGAFSVRFRYSTESDDRAPGVLFHLVRFKLWCCHFSSKSLTCLNALSTIILSMCKCNGVRVTMQCPQFVVMCVIYCHKSFESSKLSKSL